MKLWCVNTAIFCVAAIISFGLPDLSIDSFGEWILFAAGAFLRCTLVVLSVNGILFRQHSLDALERFKRIFFRRH